MATTKKTSTKEAKNVYEALSRFQEECPTFAHNAKGYSYKYVDLTEILRVIKPILTKHDLILMQPLDRTGIETQLHHVPTGTEISSFVEIPQGVELRGMNAFQAYGSAITYFRRYSIISLLNISSDKDLDASGEQIKKPSVNIPKRKLSATEFSNALEAIEKGDYTKEELRQNFELNNEQLKSI